MNIIDTHAHIDQLEDFEGAMARAAAAGVTDIMAMSVDLASMRRVLELSGRTRSPRIHAALGIHPGTINPDEQTEAVQFMRTNAGRVKAIGETGLDYWYKWVRKNETERRKQKDSFAVHLQTAQEYNLPIVIHSRGAWRDCLSMTKESGVKRALFHWYSGPLDILAGILTAGYYVSTSPSVGYSPESRAAMAEAPVDRILIETDSPVRYKDGEAEFLAEPKDVLRTLTALAALKNIDMNTLGARVNQNARDFFRI